MGLGSKSGTVLRLLDAYELIRRAVIQHLRGNRHGECASSAIVDFPYGVVVTDREALLFGPQWRSLVGIRRSKRHQKREEERKLEGGKGKRKAQGFSSRGGGEEEEAGR